MKWLDAAQRFLRSIRSSPRSAVRSARVGGGSLVSHPTSRRSYSRKDNENARRRRQIANGTLGRSSRGNVKVAE
ncbi:MAG: hypothetical protein ACYTFQ_33285 [Planctomycetota bacterium]